VQVRATVVEALQLVAPELDGTALHDTELLRNQVDLDSYDWLNFLLEVHRRLGVDIPESDYARLATLEQIISYVLERAS
jgi:acyl carrier protein